jgi:hypothetical protein
MPYNVEFDSLPTGGALPLSRNSVGHGVAYASEFNLESALIAILVCHQLFYCFPISKA